MSTFVLVPGAGGSAWYWHRLAPLLRRSGHETIAIDLPGDDERAGLEAYARIVVDAIESRSDVILVAQSLAGFTAPLVCARAPVRMLVFVNAMIPTPGETAGDWWDHTGATAARTDAAKRAGYGTDFDIATYFLHDVPDRVARGGAKHQRPEAKIVFTESCRFAHWPAVPIHVVVGTADRFFPPDFQRRIAQERLGREVDEVSGGHLVALSNPEGLARRLLSYAAELLPSRRESRPSKPKARVAPRKAVHRMRKKPETIDAYLASVEPDKRAVLERLRKAILSVIPDAEECISYSMPAFRHAGHVVAGFLATSKGCSYFPFSGTTLATVAADVKGYDQTKSALHFDPKHPLPLTLVRKLLKARIAENDGKKTGGTRRGSAGRRRSR